ncbi:MAG TPA: ABC transporter permease [Anaerolineales bacterium]|nr:ABC transporter permease [Anaerolineales bacterium]
MWKYLVNRLVQILITLLIFFALTYFILDAQPGDITLLYMHPRFTEEQRLMLQRRLGLDRPASERFVRWLGNTMQGDLGDSFVENKPVMEIIKERAPRTVFLFLTSTLAAFIVGYMLGKVLAWQRGTALEYGITVIGAILYTIFTPWFALVMVWLFSYNLKWFPLGKFLDPTVWRKIPPDSPITANLIFNRLLLTATLIALAILVVVIVVRKINPNQAGRLTQGLSLAVIALAIVLWATYEYSDLAWDIVRHLILPVMTLTIINFSGTMLLTRTTMLETLREDYIMAARAKGLSEQEVRDKHAARNALLPVFTSLVISLPFIMSGGIITETVFSWPGMGLTLLEAANSNDIPMIMGAFLFIGILSLVAHLVADIAYVFLDPRIRYA